MGGGQAGKIIAQAAQQLAWLGGGVRRDGLGLEPGGNEGVNGVGAGVSRNLGHGRFLWFLIGPVFFGRFVRFFRCDGAGHTHDHGEQPQADMMNWCFGNHVDAYY